jgi:hypothetical protein
LIVVDFLPNVRRENGYVEDFLTSSLSHIIDVCN